MAGQDPADGGPDRALLALEDLVRAAERMQQALELLTARAGVIRRCRAEGLPYQEIVTREDRPLIAELLTDTLRQFQAAGTRFRQAEAQALHAEGLTLEQIGELFGLTRQRISTLIGPRTASTPGQPTPPGTPTDGST